MEDEAVQNTIGVCKDECNTNKESFTADSEDDATAAE